MKVVNCTIVQFLHVCIDRYGYAKSTVHLKLGLHSNLNIDHWLLIAPMSIEVERLKLGLDPNTSSRMARLESPLSLCLNCFCAHAGLCSWVVNIIGFYNVYCDVEPKRRALETANADLAAAEDKLARIKYKIKVLGSLFWGELNVTGFEKKMHSVKRVQDVPKLLIQIILALLKSSRTVTCSVPEIQVEN